MYIFSLVKDTFQKYSNSPKLQISSYFSNEFKFKSLSNKNIRFANTNCTLKLFN